MKKSIDTQLALVDQIVSSPDQSSIFVQSPNLNKTIEIELEIAIRNNISHLGAAKRVFGIRDSQKYSRKTQRWEGYVLEITTHGFSAKLEDLNRRGTYEFADFSFDEISPDDQELVKIGALFYYSIGFNMVSGQIEKADLLRFKRVPDWSLEEYDLASDRASELFKKLKWD